MLRQGLIAITLGSLLVAVSALKAAAAGSKDAWDMVAHAGRSPA